MKVFLGGTCNGSTWRDDLIPLLKVDYFNPVVEDWTPECQAREVQERENADFAIYTITPKMSGVYAVAEAVDDSNKRPEKTVFCLLTTDGENAFTAGQLKSLDAVGKMITRNGGHWFSTLENVANLLNGLAAQATEGIVEGAKVIDNSLKDDGVPMSRFYLNRTKDETGVSRTGRVLEGVLTQSGQVIIQWRPPHTSIGIYNSFAEFNTIHVDCHPSCSEVVWLDAPPNCPES